jgi:hypothetical protein
VVVVGDCGRNGPLVIVVPGTDSNDRAAVVRELKEMFLGHFKELVRRLARSTRSWAAGEAPFCRRYSSTLAR